MRNKIPSQFVTILSRICLLAVVAAFLMPVPASALTKSDKGTILELPDDAYRVPESFLYEVRPNDNLHWLAAKFYGDPRQWVTIHQANREKLRDPSLLQIGQQLLIPARP